METITLQYDATNPALKGLIAALLKLDGISKAKTTKKKSGLDEAIDDLQAIAYAVNTHVDFGLSEPEAEKDMEGYHE